MLTCIARSKQPGDDSVSRREEMDSSTTASTKHNQAIKSLTSQLRDMALKASGAYRHCNPSKAQSRLRNSGEFDADSERIGWSYRRTGSSSSATPRTWGKEMEARLKGMSSSSGEATPKSLSGSRVYTVVFAEENEPREWVAQVEPGVLITFVSLPGGGNDLKRIRFSQLEVNEPYKNDPFVGKCLTNGKLKDGGQRIMIGSWNFTMFRGLTARHSRYQHPLELKMRQVHRLLPAFHSSSKMESAEESPVTPPLTNERLPCSLHRPTGMGMAYSSSDSLDQHSMQSRHYCDSGLTSTPKLSSISGAKTDISSMDASMRSSSSREADRSGEPSISNASDLETEWVEMDEPGVYITIRALPGDKRELRRVRFRNLQHIKLVNIAGCSLILAAPVDGSSKSGVHLRNNYEAPGKVWRDACQTVVGREPSQDTQTILVIERNGRD
ncbi:Protein Brevis radix-like 4 [Hibiscus syriacus]|uniref:Protein Brevis radix-like 4 n=1 Tax=Hibiscus syriacus TaxID=106335 RepID=A0A6A2XAM5_HIBSY|nr:Protein Brevis radix-like 4 [Hibiscus syriacus]